jgi:hypothetical protein
MPMPIKFKFYNIKFKNYKLSSILKIYNYKIISNKEISKESAIKQK